MTTPYEAFVAAKLAPHVPTGIPSGGVSPNYLFAFQRDLVDWALRRGRSAIFAATGLGKSRMQVKWAWAVAEYTGRPVLIMAPLAVASQTAAEGTSIGMPVTVVKSGEGIRDRAPNVYVTNYDRLHLFDPSIFGGVVLDESSIIKHHNAKTLSALLEAFARTQFKLCCTATPAPNDYVELGTHAEFLGICTRAEMLSEFFVHDGGDTQVWRLKGHARQAFWRWVASWAALVRRPEDLGYDARDYELPPLAFEQHVIPADDESVRAAGLLCAVPATTLMERRQARKASIYVRVARCAELVLADNEPWVVWCELNAEQDALEKLFGEQCASVYGSLDADEKELRLRQFVDGDKRIMLSKPSIAGFGLNWQHCARMAFVGVNDSWEAQHQCVRRIWRFGQKRPCVVHIFASEAERAVLDNLARKGRDAEAMAEELSRETGEMVRAAVRGTERETNEYAPRAAIRVPAWCSSIEAPAEEWRLILGGNYEVSNTAKFRRVTPGRRTYPGREFAPILLKNGYYSVAPTIDGKNVPMYLHDVVAAAFLGPKPEGSCVNHIDGVKTHNVPSNLEYVTHAENMAHAARTGLSAVGERHGNSKLTRDAVIEMRAKRASGARTRDLASEYGVSPATVSDVCSGKKWKSV